MSDERAPSEEPKGRIWTVIFDFDANALITACKFALEGRPLIDLLLDHCAIQIPQSVAEEATRNPRHPDARLAARRISDGSLVPKEPSACT